MSPHLICLHSTHRLGRGRYKFKRLPFGVHCASEIFSKRISELLNGLDGVAHIQDDIIIWGDGKEQRDNRLRLVLDRIKSCGLKPIRAKCVFRIKEIKYVGHILSHEGLQVNPSKIEAIVNMPVPENTSDVHRFLGMITYLGRFIHNPSSKTSELRKLLQKDQALEWSKKHSDQFRNLQTYEGNPLQTLAISVHSHVDAIKFLLSEGFKYVLTETFMQNVLEDYFRHQREKGRRSDNPTAQQFGYNDLTISCQRDIAPVIRGNVDGRYGKVKWHQVSDEPVRKAKIENNHAKT